jgi:hypothetical protein
MEIDSPNLCPICKKPIPPKRYRLLTCGSYFCSNAAKGITRRNSIKKGSVVGIAKEDDFNKIRNELKRFFLINGHPRYSDRDDFEEWIQASGVCKEMKQTTLRQAITTLLTNEDFGYVKLGGSSRGRKHVKFMYVGGSESEEGISIASDS